MKRRSMAIMGVGRPVIVCTHASDRFNGRNCLNECAPHMTFARARLRQKRTFMKSFLLLVSPMRCLCDAGCWFECGAHTCKKNGRTYVYVLYVLTCIISVWCGDGCVLSVGALMKSLV